MTSQRPILRAGDVDWVERWRELSRASGLTQSPGEDRWSRRAKRFARFSKDRDGLVDLFLPMLEPSDVVVDIGAGAGRHTFPLAAKVAHVIALEPSAGMRVELEARLAEEKRENIAVSAATWPAPLDREVDVAFSSHVLYAIEDAATFLHAMSTSARRLAALFLSPWPPVTALDPLRAAIHGAARPRPPGAIEAVSLLFQLGYRAELREVPGSAHTVAYADSGDDLRELASRMDVEPDAAGEAKVADALRRVGRRQDDGRFAIGEMGPHYLITWRTR